MDELKRDKKKQKKNLVLLSFGEEAGEEDAEVAALAAATQIRSAFDAVTDDDPRSGAAGSVVRPASTLLLLTESPDQNGRCRLVKSGTELADKLAAQEAAEDAERRRLKTSVRAALAKKASTLQMRGMWHLLCLLKLQSASTSVILCFCSGPIWHHSGLEERARFNTNGSLNHLAGRE